jgi:hypothetical protein
MLRMVRMSKMRLCDRSHGVYMERFGWLADKRTVMMFRIMNGRIHQMYMTTVTVDHI